MNAVFPFFVGSGRSGTTLVRAIFDSHPHLAIPGESNFISAMGKNRHRYETDDGLATEAFLSDLLAHPRFRLWGVPEDAIRTSFAESPPGNFADGVRRAFELYAAQKGKSRYGDKTPGYVMHLPLLARLFPEARFVHIIRDGRNVALSYLEVSFGPESIEQAALRWRRFVARGRRTGARLGPKRYLEVRYEDLIEDPEETVQTMCQFLDIRFDPQMFRYPERATEVAQGSAFPEVHGHLGLPPTTGLRDWRAQMSANDLTTFEILAGDVLSEMGYERAVTRPGISKRARATGKRLRLETARVRRRLGKRSRMVETRSRQGR
jgi:Sulfotransferase family